MISVYRDIGPANIPSTEKNYLHIKEPLKDEVYCYQKAMEKHKEVTGCEQCIWKIQLVGKCFWRPLQR